MADYKYTVTDAEIALWQPSKLNNASEFTATGQHFKDYGTYTNYVKNDNPLSPYYKFWQEEMRRCRDGYHIGSDYITGYNYFYLNYSPIEKTEIISSGEERNRADRVTGFPRMWDMDKEYFLYVEECEKAGKHGVVLKARGKGYSFKGASMLCRNYYCFPNSVSYAFAENKGYLLDDGLLSKSFKIMDFIDQYTEFGKRRVVDQPLHKHSGLKRKVNGVERIEGYNSHIIGVSFKNNPEVARGKRGKLILWEEAGNFKDLLQSWRIAMSSVKQGDNVFGTMIAFGCVCAGTKVYKNDGSLINIEELKQEDGIIGYNSYSYVQQDIEKFRIPHFANCYRITTNTGRYLECSEDHPIVYSHMTMSKRVPGMRHINAKMKYWKWKQAKDIKIGEQLGTIEDVQVFGNNEIWQPRLIGWLIGDGSYGKDKTPVLSNCEKEINDYVLSNFDSVVERCYLTKKMKYYQETRIRNICPKLRELGIYGQSKNNKRLPNIISSCTKETICELLGGLFDTDGYIADIKKRIYINITSSSKDLLLEIMYLMQKIGIHGNIQSIKPSKKNPIDKNIYYRLDIRDIKSLYNFSQQITFFTKEKQDRLNEYKEKLDPLRSELSKYILGIRFERVVSVENIGYKKVYNIQASDTHTYIANGIVTHNTGGSEGADFEAMEQLFYSPKAYDILPVKNIWDDGLIGTECGFFVSDATNYEGAMNEDTELEGNSEIRKAVKKIINTRTIIANEASNPTELVRAIAEHPLKPQEAVLRTSGTAFPIQDLKTIRNNIKINPDNIEDSKLVGRLDMAKDSFSVMFVPDSTLIPINEYPLNSNTLNKEGCIVIYETPIKDSSGDVAFGRYLAATDPYSQDSSSGDSLGATYVLDKATDRIVAEYVGRPLTTKMYYENVRRLMIYYNALNNHENDVKGMRDYFEQMNSSHLLADTPNCIKDKIDSGATLSRPKGTPGTASINAYGRDLIVNWLWTPLQDGKFNMHTIKSIGLLDELINWNNKGNFDRVSSLEKLMIIREEKVRINIDYNEKIDVKAMHDVWRKLYYGK